MYSPCEDERGILRPLFQEKVSSWGSIKKKKRNVSRYEFIVCRPLLVISSDRHTFRRRSPCFPKQPWVTGRHPHHARDPSSGSTLRRVPFDRGKHPTSCGGFRRCRLNVESTALRSRHQHRVFSGAWNNRRSGAQPPRALIERDLREFFVVGTTTGRMY